MGIIARQTVQSNLFIYLGVIIGFLNSGILLPMFFSPEEKGLLDYMNSISAIFSSIFAVGIPLVLIKLYPKYRQSRVRGAFISRVKLFTLFGIIAGSASFLGYFYLFSDNQTELEYMSYFPLLVCVIIVFRILFRAGDAYMRMNLRSVIGAFLENFVLKGLILSLLGLSLLGLMFDKISLFYGIVLCVPGIWLLIVLFLFKPKASETDDSEVSELDTSEFNGVALFGILGSVGGIFVMLLDQIMVKEMISVSANGIYTFGFYLGMFVSIPGRGLKRIAAAIISESWSKNDLGNIRLVYSKSVLNQSIIALYFFLGIWFCSDYLFTFLKPEYAAAKNVLLFIGVAQLIDMATGVNFEVIASSEKYRYNTYFLVLLIILVIGLNLVLIPEYQLEGAALASLVAMFIVNTTRYFFLWRVYGFQPFNSRVLYLIIIAGGVFAVLWLLPSLDNPYLGIFMNGLILTILFWGSVLGLRLSKEMNDLFRTALKRIGVK